VVVLFAAEIDTAATVKNPVINGFEINTPNSTKQAHTPFPPDRDEHVDADLGSLLLSWSPAPAGGVTAHHVYFGTEAAAVASASLGSAEYRGSQAATSFSVGNLSSHRAYYWRIDQVDTLGNLTKGNVWRFRPRQLAFPGAEGYGRYAIGGRGGAVVAVTSLEDYLPNETPIPGTLRWAIQEHSGPRVIVFHVSGLITLRSRLSINQPYLTLAGQTAPGKGITLRNYTMGLSGARDVIIRHLRARPGNLSGTNVDGMGMSGSDHCIIDHCSISWSIDEAFSSRSARNITLQRTLISEALNIAGHSNYPAGTQHGYAASIGGDVGSFHHNLLAHNFGRNWSLAGGLDAAGFFAGRLDIRNNVVYNWGHRATDGGAHEVNFVGNYYKPGAATTYFYALNAQYENFPGTQRYHFSGNVMPGRFNESSQNLGYTQTGLIPTYPTFLPAPFFPGHVQTFTAKQAYKRVLSSVGANRPRQDEHDARMIRETRDGTFTYYGSISGKPGLIDSQNDVGGWEPYPIEFRPADWDTDGDGLPDWWELARGLNPNSPAGDFSDGHLDADGDGFTEMCDYLAWMAAPHFRCAVDGSLDIDLSQFTRGYTASPVHQVTSVVQGSVVMLDSKTARFTPVPGYRGLASFDFTVFDAEGDSLAQTVHLRVDLPVQPSLGMGPNAAKPTLRFIGPAGRTFRIQRSFDLVNWTDWRAIAASDNLQVIDLADELTAAPKAFFRVVEP
jgi:hypothetical protein